MADVQVLRKDVAEADQGGVQIGVHALNKTKKSCMVKIVSPYRAESDLFILYGVINCADVVNKR